VRLLSVHNVLTTLGAELAGGDDRLLPLGLGSSKVGEALCTPPVNPVKIDLLVQGSWAAKRVVCWAYGESGHGSTLVLLPVAVRLDSVVGTIVVDHAGPVDARDVELIDEIQALRLADSLRGAARLDVARALSLPATLAAPSVLSLTLTLSVVRGPANDRRLGVASWTAVVAVVTVVAVVAALTVIGAPLPWWTRTRTAVSGRPARVIPPAITLLLVWAARAVASTGVGVASVGGRTGRFLALGLVIEG
jgi:hypothetical protein